MNGTIVKHEEFVINSIDINDLKNGIYQLQLLSSSTQYVNKFVIIK